MSLRAIRLLCVAAFLLLGGGVATLGSGIRIIRGSLSDLLAGAFVYFLIQSLRPLQTGQTVILAIGISSLIELGQWFHLSAHIGLPPASLSAMLLGNTYNLTDLGMYAFGGLGAGWLDQFAHRAHLRVHSGLPSSNPSEVSP